MPGLQDQTILIASAASVSGERLTASFAAAGASGLKFKSGDFSDVDDLLKGKAAAAIIAVATPKTAAMFQAIPGYQLMLVDVPLAEKP